MSLRKWLDKNNYFFYKKDLELEANKEFVSKVEKTHTCYDGGIVHVPEKEYYNFLKNYSVDVVNKVPLHYIEQRGSIYKFMVDLDVYDKESLTQQEIVEMVSLINNVINEFYGPMSDLTSIICTCNGRPKTDKDGRIHTGIHIIFPKLFVNDSISKLFRSAILQKIKDMEYKSNYVWDDVFDQRIYNGNGFTMVGSSKMDTPDRIYMPSIVISRNGIIKDIYLESLLKDPVRMMLETSIRYIPESIKHANFSAYSPIIMPNWLNQETVESAEKSSIVKANKGPKSSRGYENTNSTVYKIIIGMIFKYMPEYRDEPSLIREIYRYPDQNGNPDKNGPLLIVTNSRYCTNLGREHNSCGIFFYANRKGLCQKCLCPCNNLVGRKNGLCSAYTSDYYPFDPEIQELLFNNEKIKFRKVDDDVVCNKNSCGLSDSEETERSDIDKVDKVDKVDNVKKADKPKKEKKEKADKNIMAGPMAPDELDEKKKKKPAKKMVVGKFTPGMTSGNSEVEQFRKNIGHLLKGLSNLEK